MESRQPGLFTSPGLSPVPPAEPAAPWVGGKRNLAGRLTAIIEEIPHATYAEPFVGMGGVFFRRGLRPKCEVINDRSRDVATFFRILREHYVPFVEMLRYQITTRSEFERLQKVDPETLTDLQRAARFLYLQRTAFGGKVDGRNFAMDPGAPAAFDVTRLTPVLEALHERLRGVVIECLPYEKLIAHYDRPDTLFYLDPPYHGSEDYYGPGLFSTADFARLAEQLAGIAGTFVLSVNDTAHTREIFGRFKMIEVDVTHTLAAADPLKVRELIVTGPA